MTTAGDVEPYDGRVIIEDRDGNVIGRAEGPVRSGHLLDDLATLGHQAVGGLDNPAPAAEIRDQSTDDVKRVWKRIVPEIPDPAVRAIAQAATPMTMVADTLLVAVAGTDPQDQAALMGDAATIGILSAELGRPVRLAVTADPDA